MPSPKYQRRSPFDWQDLIAQQAKSGMTIAEFCDATGLSPSTFNNWKRRLRNNTVAEAPSVDKDDALFVSLPVSTAISDDQHSASHWDIELDLGDGMCLRLRRSS